MPEIPVFISQRLPTSDPGLARVDARLLGAPAQALQQAGRAVTEEALDFGFAQRRARQADELARLNHAATLQLGELELGLARDGAADPRGLPGRFDEQARLLKDELLAGATSGLVRRRLAANYDTLVATKAVAVRRDAFKLEASQGVAALDTELPDFARAAAAAGTETERALIVGEALKAIEDREATGFIGAQAAEARRRGFRSSLAEHDVLQGIELDPRATLAQLEGGGFANLDLGEADRLAERARNEIERRARTQRATLGAQVQEALAVLRDGQEFTGVNTLQETLDADHALADLATQLREASQDRGALAEFRRSPIADQAAELRRLSTQASFTGRENRLFNSKLRMHAVAGQAVTTDPLGHAQAVGLFDLATVDPTDAGSLALRAQQAAQASAHFGVAVPALRNGEADALAQQLEAAEPRAVTGQLQALVEGLGHDGALRVAGQIVSDRPATAIAVLNATHAPLVSERIIRGDRLLRDNADVRPTKLQRIAAVKSVYGDDLFGAVDGTLDHFVAAAEAAYAALKVPTGDLSYSDSLFKEALRLVAGGALTADGRAVGGPIDFNGRKILPPVPGMEERELRAHIEALTIADLLAFGNGPPVLGDGTPFQPGALTGGTVARLLGSRATLVSVGAGRYRVELDSGFVAVAGGGAYELDLRALVTGERRSPRQQIAVAGGPAP